MKRFIILFILYTCSMGADELTIDPPELWESECSACAPSAVCLPYTPLSLDENVSVNVTNPTYIDGVLMTEEGGVLESQDVRIQARKIIYTKKINDALPTYTVSCEGDILVDYQRQTIAGDALFYDFLTHQGRILNGKMAAFPWFLAGEEIVLCSDGTIKIHNGYITTSETCEHEVMVHAPLITIIGREIVVAEDVTFRILDLPFFWVPRAQVDLSRDIRMPFAINAGWGGYLGSHVGIRAHFLSWRELKGYARLDGYLGRGLGGGIETEYNPRCSPTEFYTRSYYAHDLSIDDPNVRDRYRFQGTYSSLFWDHTLSCNAIYDFVSDAQFAADYVTDDFDLPTAHRTELDIRKRNETWLANIFARVRVNDFQSINQELPTFEWHLHPFTLADSPLVFENKLKAGFLHYVFSDDIPLATDFHSGRFEIQPHLYAPVTMGIFRVTPSAKFIGIAYTNNQEKEASGQYVGHLSLHTETDIGKGHPSFHHTLTPYTTYNLYTGAGTSFNNHYIFTLEDAYAPLSILRFGVRQALFLHPGTCPPLPLWIGLWANAFFEDHNPSTTVPKGYLNFEFHPLPFVFLSLDTAWNFQESLIDFYNMGCQWAVSENLALSAEYRHRSAFDWRKADFYNFFLESVRSQEELLDSALSDRRDIFSAKLFYRVTPDTSATFEWRQGWNRVNEEGQPAYREYRLKVEQVIFQHWHLLFSYEKRTEDHRFYMTLKLSPGALLPGKNYCY